jgi:hypothetical protein
MLYYEEVVQEGQYAVRNHLRSTTATSVLSPRSQQWVRLYAVVALKHLEACISVALAAYATDDPPSEKTVSWPCLNAIMSGI